MPAHIGLGGAEVMLTDGVTGGFTVYVIVFDVVVVGLTHAAVDVIITDIAAPFVKPVVV